MRSLSSVARTYALHSTAGSRILVQDSIYDEFLPLLLEAARAAKVGDPLKKDTFIGAQVTKLHFDRIMGYIEKGKAGGAKVAIGGKRAGDKGCFIEVFRSPVTCDRA